MGLNPRQYEQPHHTFVTLLRTLLWNKLTVFTLNYFRKKNYVIDIWQGPQYASRKCFAFKIGKNKGDKLCKIMNVQFLKNSYVVDGKVNQDSPTPMQFLPNSFKKIEMLECTQSFVDPCPLRFERALKRLASIYFDIHSHH